MKDLQNIIVVDNLTADMICRGIDLQTLVMFFFFRQPRLMLSAYRSAISMQGLFWYRYLQIVRWYTSNIVHLDFVES
jgi:hypothetical protein